MFGYKQCLALGALMLVSFTIAAAANCEGCLGEKLLQVAKTFEDQEHCLFSSKHHYLLKLKLRVLGTVTDQFQKLVTTANGLVAPECQAVTQTKSCSTLATDEQANCHIGNIKAYVQSYHDVEACNGKALAIPGIKMEIRFLQAVIYAWKQIHTTC